MNSHMYTQCVRRLVVSSSRRSLSPGGVAAGAMARRRPSSGLPVLPRSTSGVRPRKRRTGLPPGVSYTTSGKYQARIKLNGKRRDLGTFECEEDAAAAYLVAKTTGTTDRPSPDGNRSQCACDPRRLCLTPRACVTHPPLCVMAVLDSLTYRARTARIYFSDMAAACSMAPRVWDVHVVCASSGVSMRASSACACCALASTAPLRMACMYVCPTAYG